MPTIRLDKLIADCGLASRREASQLVKNGFVLLNGEPARSGDMKVDPETDSITVCGAQLRYKRARYFMMNKPAGCVSATEDPKEKTVLDLLGGADKNLGLFPAGRLDKDAEGLLLLTNDGDWAHRVISPSKDVYKTYYAETDGRLTSEDISAFAEGLVLKDGLRCLPAVLEIIRSGETSACYVKVREGKYHQVKRMLASRQNPVTLLRRVAIGSLRLDDRLSPGEYRELEAAEIVAVFQKNM